MATQARNAQIVVEVAATQDAQVEVSRVIAQAIIPTPPADAQVSRIILQAIVVIEAVTTTEYEMLCTIS